MNEATLKRALKKALAEAMPGAVVVRHEDTSTAGIPDISVTWSGRTAWLEVKYARRGRKSEATALQEDMLKRLGAAGAPTFLVTYREPGRDRPLRSVFVHQYLRLNDGVAVWTTYGFDHRRVAERAAEAIRG